MKNIKRILAVALPLLFATCMYGQKNYKLTGKIISATNTPIADAIGVLVAEIILPVSL